jgi:hypothetical protein
MKKLLFMFLLLIPLVAHASPPSREKTYTTGKVIEASDVTANEDAIFNYLTRGVDTYYDASIENADLAGNISDTKLSTITTANKVNGSAINGALNVTTVNCTTISATNVTVTSINASNTVTGVTAVFTGSATISKNVTADYFAGNGSTLTGLNASNISYGTVPTARLGTGTASAANFLRGNQTWSSTIVSSNDTDAGTSYNDTEDEFLNISRSVTSGSTVFVIASGYFKTGATAGNQTVRLKSSTGGITLQSVSANMTKNSTCPWTCTALVTGLSGTNYFTAWAISEADAQTVYGNMVVLEF